MEHVNIIRTLFHSVNNHLHRASIHAGLLRAVNKEDVAMGEKLALIEKGVLQAADDLEKIKDIVYKEFGLVSGSLGSKPPPAC